MEEFRLVACFVVVARCIPGKRSPAPEQKSIKNGAKNVNPFIYVAKRGVLRIVSNARRFRATDSVNLPEPGRSTDRT